MSSEKLNPCVWCGKRGRNTSEWEQFSSYRNRGWAPLCVRCANRRLRNPWNAILPMRRIDDATHRHREHTVTAPDDAPSPDREPAQVGELFPDVTDRLAEVVATRRVDDRHTEEEKT